MARHCRSLAEQGVLAQIERLTNAAHFRNINKGKPLDEWELPTLLASKETLANACNVSINTVGRHLDSLVEQGILKLKSKQFRRNNGTWSENVYTVELHDHYAADHSCPPFTDEKPAEDNPNPFPAKDSPYTEEQMLWVYEDRQDGYTFQQIAARSGIPKTQVHRLYKKALRIARQNDQSAFNALADF